MKIMGIDPGLAILGWSVIGHDSGRPQRIDYGCIRTESNQTLARRLNLIFEDLNALMDRHKPDELALETLFFAKNAKTLAQVGHTRGVILLAAGRRRLPIAEYAPRQIKIALTGFGGADKKQMQSVVQRMLHLPSIPKPDDAADAVAVALCHMQYARSGLRSSVTV